MTSGKLFVATAMPDRNWWRALWPDPDAVIKAIGIGPAMTVVDLGCGDGYLTAAIARHAHLGHVIGIDLDPTLLERARAVCTGMANCECVLGDAMELNRLISKPVEYILIANTFHGVQDKVGLAKEVFAALNHGSRFGIVNWHLLPHEEPIVMGIPRGPRTDLRMSPEQTREVVETAGFKLETLVELPPYHYGAIFYKED